MDRHLYIAVNAWGDNVVSMRLLLELRNQANLRILGTDYTRELASILRFDAFPVVAMPGVSSIYNVRAAGVLRAGLDFLKLRATLASLTSRNDVVLFENQRRPGTHRLLSITAGGFRYREPAWTHSAYEDRRRMLEATFGFEIPLPPTRLPPPRPRKILIAPAARKGFRAFPAAVVRNLLEYADSVRAEVCLVDPYCQYPQFRGRVERYLCGQALGTSVEELWDSDLVFASDSLFMHLAYYAGVAVVALVPVSIARAFYFAPPGMLDRGLFMSFDEAHDPDQLFSHIDTRPRLSAPLAAAVGI